METIDPISMLRPRRPITGMSAILLPFLKDYSVDWDSFENHLARTKKAGLIPAVNMDTGYLNLLDDAVVQQVLDRTSEVLKGDSFVAGAWVKDAPGDSFSFDGYSRAIERIQKSGGIPVITQSYGLAHHTDETIVSNYRRLAVECDRFIAFELGTMFAPHGAIYSLDVYRELLGLQSCIGAKHSSLDRIEEWKRLQLRDQVRPDFMVLTGNDLAIDMVMYGSDYLLGLSTFCPDLFALRDRYWQQGSPEFYRLNDWLQYLGCFAFRHPTGGYKHNAAMFLKLREWIQTDLTHPQSVERPSSDAKILEEILRQLQPYETNQT